MNNLLDSIQIKKEQLDKLRPLLVDGLRPSVAWQDDCANASASKKAR
jgi:hypothetical protein